MKKTFLLAGLGAGIVAILAVSVAYAANSNYGAWKTMAGSRGGRAADVVNEQNFDQFTKMHQLMADGNYAEAQKIRLDLGLGRGKGQGGCGMANSANGQGSGCGMHNGSTGEKENFVDANNNGICDRMEQAAK